MTVADDGRTAELLDAERRLQAAQLAGDVEVLDQLLDDRLIATLMPEATLSTKAEDLAAHRSRELELSRLAEDDLAVVVVGTTAVTRVLLTLSGWYRGVPFTGKMLYTRTWHHSPAHGWRVLAAHISPL